MGFLKFLLWVNSLLHRPETDLVCVAIKKATTTHVSHKQNDISPKKSQER